MANKLLKYTKGDQDYLICCGTAKSMTQDGSTLVDNNYFYNGLSALTLSAPVDTFQGVNLTDIGNDMFVIFGGANLYHQYCTIKDGTIRPDTISSPVNVLNDIGASGTITFGKGYMAQQTLSYNGSRWAWNKHLTQLYMPQTDNFFCVKLEGSSGDTSGATEGSTSWRIRGNLYEGNLRYYWHTDIDGYKDMYFVVLAFNGEDPLGEGKSVIIVKNRNGYKMMKNYTNGNNSAELYTSADTYDWLRKDGCEIHVWLASYDTIMARVAILQNMSDPDFDYQLFETAAMNLKVPCIKFIYTPKYDGSDTEGWIAC